MIFKPGCIASSLMYSKRIVIGALGKHAQISKQLKCWINNATDNP